MKCSEATRLGKRVRVVDHPPSGVFTLAASIAKVISTQLCLFNGPDINRRVGRQATIEAGSPACSIHTCLAPKKRFFYECSFCTNRKSPTAPRSAYLS